jgi:hypothetical protein
MVPGIFQAVGMAVRWISEQIGRFPVPIEEVVYVKAYADPETARRLAHRPAAHALKFRRFQEERQ